jgi:hypothetical protein
LAAAAGKVTIRTNPEPPEMMTMGMKQTLDVINKMEADRIISRYAIAGAVAAYNYIEPTLTEDLDLLVSFPSETDEPQSSLLSLQPVHSYLKQRGYDRFRAEGIMIEGWPVQFLPVSDDLDAEALAGAIEADIQIPNEGTARTRLLRAEHLVAVALRVGRPKDLIRIAQFIESEAVDLALLQQVLDRHKLTDAWRSFCLRTGITDPFSASHPS